MSLLCLVVSSGMKNRGKVLELDSLQAADGERFWGAVVRTLCQIPDLPSTH